MADASPNVYSAFFYGTLMHPKVLSTVIGNRGTHLRFCPAVLLDHTRHRIKFADYPGVVAFSEGRQLFSHQTSQEERSVRGTLVTGLSESDIAQLDRFEGSEYKRGPVNVHPLAEFQDFKASVESATFLPPNPLPLPSDISQLPPPTQADTYIYLYVGKLEPELWSFSDFVTKNARKWYSNDWDSEPDHAEEFQAYNGVKESIIERRKAAGTMAVT